MSGTSKGLSCSTASRYGQSLVWTPRKGTHCQAEPGLGPAIASATGNSFKLGRDGGGTNLCSQTLPAGTKRPQTWRVPGRGSATAKGYAQALEARKRALLLPAINTMFPMICSEVSCENARQKLWCGVCYVNRKQKRYLHLFAYAGKGRMVGKGFPAAEMPSWF